MKKRSILGGLCLVERARSCQLLHVAFDESLADRIRDVLASRPVLSEREMFGGIAFMLAGNMAVGVIGDDQMVRLDPADAEKALQRGGEKNALGGFVNSWETKPPPRMP